jgi:quinol monooxygenase YgiN
MQEAQVVIADMFGSPALRDELRALLAQAERDATSRDGCLRYSVGVSLADPDRYVVVEEWRDKAALEAHYASEEFRRFQFELHDLLVRSSEATIHSVSASLRPVASGPIDPRDAD